MIAVTIFAGLCFGFDPQVYSQFLLGNQDLTAARLLENSKPAVPRYASIQNGTGGVTYAFLDSIKTKYSLTENELNLLEKNGFVITERQSYTCFGKALHDIYSKDLPVFVTTDAVLYALHKSYDDILLETETAMLAPQLTTMLKSLYAALPGLAEAHKQQLMQTSLSDVDCYITMALSLTDSVKRTPALPSTGPIEDLWSLVDKKQMSTIPLFTETTRNIDFSQFTVRGHYTRSKVLSNYFRAMMWLGRIDFLLTAPKGEIWPEKDMQRMTIDACLLNELITLAGVRSQLTGIDQFLTLLIGESDNLVPSLLFDIAEEFGLKNSEMLLQDSVYSAFRSAVVSNPGSGQKILSDFFIMDPFASTPDTLPVSFKLLGQRFIIDSYLLGNVVYDRVIFNNTKIYRMMPDPLDAMYALGNNDALPLLKPQLDQYPYAPELSALRYLVDAYEPSFWQQSLYNSWLHAIRLLTPDNSRAGLPLFMKTSAWHQEKLNTQLSSWAQLRHDNLLYAKQSYTGGSSCSFPHSYIEPYPEFYHQISLFADKAAQVFSISTNIPLKSYFPNLARVMNKLDTLAQKELAGTSFSSEDTAFLHKMLFLQGGSGAPPFSGWYADLFFNRDCVEDSDYVVADVHTQPTDEAGNVVGRVLHCGTAKVNLGVFLATSPSSNYAPMAFAGPTFTYYEKITQNFERLTDESWVNLVKTSSLPARPDWINRFCANATGGTMPLGRNLEGVEYAPVKKPADKPSLQSNQGIIITRSNAGNFVIRCNQSSASPLSLRIYNQKGQIIATLSKSTNNNNSSLFYWTPAKASSGIYLFRLEGAREPLVQRMVLPSGR
jgi:hypothetical protein